jgi:hypothetical protein
MVLSTYDNCTYHISVFYAAYKLRYEKVSKTREAELGETPEQQGKTGQGGASAVAMIAACRRSPSP